MYSQQVRRDTERIRRTYCLSAGVVDRLDDVAKIHHVGQSDLVEFLLDIALEQVERGELAIPTRPQGLRAIDHEARRRDR